MLAAPCGWPHDADPIYPVHARPGSVRLARAPRPGKGAAAPGGDREAHREGWEVAGYIAAWENRTLILFKHKEHKYLVQCSVLIDVMHKPPLVTACNELK